MYIAEMGVNAMFKLGLRLGLLGSLLVVFGNTRSEAAFISKNQAFLIAKNWLAHNERPLGEEIGSNIVGIKHYFGDEYGEPGYYVFFLEPKGWVAVPADDSFEVISAFGAAAVTMMMGSGELMRQEEAFLKALADAAYFKPLKEGLALLAKDDGEIVLIPVH